LRAPGWQIVAYRGRTRNPRATRKTLPYTKARPNFSGRAVFQGCRSIGVRRGAAFSVGWDEAIRHESQRRPTHGGLDLLLVSVSESVTQDRRGRQSTQIRIARAAVLKPVTVAALGDRRGAWVARRSLVYREGGLRRKTIGIRVESTPELNRAPNPCFSVERTPSRSRNRNEGVG